MTATRELPHGTLNGYNHHRCRCLECRRAKTDYAREHDYYGTNRRVGKRAEQKRQADENLKHPCANGCGQLASRGYPLCRACYEADRRVAADARRAEIQRLWLAGESYRQIAEALGSTPGSIQTELVRMRRAGWDVPRRGPWGRARA